MRVIGLLILKNEVERAVQRLAAGLDALRRGFDSFRTITIPRVRQLILPFRATHDYFLTGGPAWQQ